MHVRFFKHVRFFNPRLLHQRTEETLVISVVAVADWAHRADRLEVIGTSRSREV